VEQCNLAECEEDGDEAIISAENDFEASRKQIEWLNLPQRRKAFVGGRGAGKSVVLCLAALRELGLRKCSGTIIAPTYTMLRDVDWPMFGDMARGVVKVIRSSAHEMEMVNGSVLRFRSGDDPERLRGINNSFFGIDEAAIAKKDVWMIGLATLREFGGPGQAWAATTPRGVKNWVYETFGIPRADHAVVYASTEDNPFTGTEFKADLRRDYGVGQWARQELDGEFCDTKGAIFHREWLKVVEKAPPEFVAITRGWDLAVSTKAAADFTCGVKLGLTADADIYVLDVVRGKQEWPDTKKIIADTARADGAECCVIIETNAFQLSAFQELYRDPALAPYPIFECRRERDKMSYALPLAARAQEGKFYMVAGSGTWIDAYRDEFSMFTGQGDEQDDQVDATTNALQHLVPPPRIERW
jgi:predicted phage terminase large subunit-like protein